MMMKFLGLAVVGMLLAGGVSAQTVSQLDITVPSGPGSGLDQTARAVEDALRKDGIVRRIQINNITGGGGMIALSQFITSQGDNPEAIMVNGAGSVFFPLTSGSGVSMADVRPLARLVGEYEVIATGSKSGIDSAEDLFATFRENPGSIAFGGGAPGSTDHIFFGRLAKSLGVEPRQVNYIPHANSGEVVISALNGQVGVVGGGLQDYIQQVQTGDMRILAVAAPERLPMVPDAPTLTELGHDLVFANFRGVVGHKNLTEDQAATIETTIKQMVEGPRWQELLTERGWIDFYLGEEEYSAFIAEQTEAAKAVLADLGLAQ